MKITIENATEKRMIRLVETIYNDQDTRFTLNEDDVKEDPGMMLYLPGELYGGGEEGNPYIYVNDNIETFSYPDSPIHGNELEDNPISIQIWAEYIENDGALPTPLIFIDNEIPEEDDWKYIEHVLAMIDTPDSRYADAWERREPTMIDVDTRVYRLIGFRDYKDADCEIRVYKDNL